MNSDSREAAELPITRAGNLSFASRFVAMQVVPDARLLAQAEFEPATETIMGFL